MNKNRKTRLIIMLAVISGYVSMGFLITVVRDGFCRLRYISLSNTGWLAGLFYQFLQYKTFKYDYVRNCHS